MGRIGIGEIIVIVAVFILLFGTKKLPEIGGSIGKAIKEFRKELKGSDSDKESPDQKSDATK